jgi:hypothetical protein
LDGDRIPGEGERPKDDRFDGVTAGERSELDGRAGVKTGTLRVRGLRGVRRGTESVGSVPHSSPSSGPFVDLRTRDAVEVVRLWSVNPILRSRNLGIHARCPLSIALKGPRDEASETKITRINREIRRLTSMGQPFRLLGGHCEELHQRSHILML